MILLPWIRENALDRLRAERTIVIMNDFIDGATTDTSIQLSAQRLEMDWLGNVSKIWPWACQWGKLLKRMIVIMRESIGVAVHGMIWEGISSCHSCNCFCKARNPDADLSIETYCLSISPDAKTKHPYLTTWFWFAKQISSLRFPHSTSRSLDMISARAYSLYSGHPLHITAISSHGLKLNLVNPDQIVRTRHWGGILVFQHNLQHSK